MEKRQDDPVVIHEDNHLLVVDKPPLMATMGAVPGEETLVEWTRNWLIDKYNKPGNAFVGVVSRLDAFTRGLIVLAKTSKAASRLTRQFQQGEVDKEYTAIIEGVPAPPEGTLIDWVVKNDQRRRMTVVAAGHPGAKRAELYYELQGTFDQLSWIRVRLLTGRKHQIRVQMSHRGWAVAGDRKYDATTRWPIGIALQSSSLRFAHPVGQDELSFQIDPPKAWKMGRFRNK